MATAFGLVSKFHNNLRMTFTVILFMMKRDKRRTKHWLIDLKQYMPQTAAEINIYNK